MSEVGRRLGRSPDWTRRECEQPDGHFPGARFDGRTWRVPAADVEAYEDYRERITARVRRGPPATTGNGR